MKFKSRGYKFRIAISSEARYAQVVTQNRVPYSAFLAPLALSVHLSSPFAFRSRVFKYYFKITAHAETVKTFVGLPLQNVILLVSFR